MFELAFIKEKGTGRASQETALSGFCQQALVGINNNLGLVTVCRMDPQVGQSLDGLCFSLSSTLCLCISSCNYFVSPSKNDWSTHTLFFLRGCKPLSAPSVLSLTPPMGTLCSVQWLAVSIHLCICQALAEPLKRQLYQAPVSMHFLTSTIVSGLCECIWDGSQGGKISK